MCTSLPSPGNAHDTKSRMSLEVVMVVKVAEKAAGEGNEEVTED